MNAGRGLTGNVTACRTILNAGHAAAESMIEDMNPGRAGDPLQQFDGRRIVNPLQLLLVPEVLDRASVAHELETRIIECNVASYRPKIIDRSGVRLLARGRPGD